MKNLNLTFSAFILLTSFVSHAAIWGEDNSRHVRELPMTEQRLSQSVAMLVPKPFITTNPDGTKNIEVYPFADTWNMCPSEKWSKHNGLYVGCTGFLIAPDRMMTAGHCMVNHGVARNEVTPFCEDFVWLFGYHEILPGVVQTRNIPANRFVECGRVIEARHDSDHSEATKELILRDDFAITTLKTPVNRPVLKLAKEDPSLNESVKMFGYPLGGPLMRTEGKVLQEHPTYFVTNLDAFQGNSGSPVLNSKNEVIGILVRGYPDSLYDAPEGRCSLINRCKEDLSSCQAEDRTYPYGEHVQKLPRKLLESP